MATHQKVRFKIGDAEFEAEGDAAAVGRQFEEFVRLLGSQAGGETASLTASLQDDGGDASAEQPVASPGVQPFADATQPERMTKSDTGLAPDDLQRLFQTTSEGTLRLVAQPPFKPVESHVFLFALYGHLALRDEHMVTAPALMNSGRASGLEIDRADTHLAGDYKKFHITTGKRRGKRYGINRAGIVHVEKLLRKWISRIKEQRE